MPATVRRLLSVPSLQLTLVEPGTSLDHRIEWVHSSDLLDPTPFLDAGHVLLTTGTQFPADAPTEVFEAYVSRLVERGVVAVGFGTEVSKSGTPIELATACSSHGLTLVQVPYRTPFIAIARWAADVIATESRERDDWSLRAQQTVSLSALGPRGLAGVLKTLAVQLDSRVAAFEPDGSFDAEVSPNSFSGPELDLLSAEAVQLLRTGHRAASTIALGEDRAFLQTLGPNGHLGGVLAIIGSAEDDSATRSVMTGAVALAEMSLEQGRIRRSSLMPLYGELLQLMLAGQTELSLRAIPHFPRGPLQVTVCRSEGDSQWFIEALERFMSTRRSRLFLAPYDDNLVAILEAADWHALHQFLSAHHVVSGVSRPVDIDHLSLGLAQALHAFEVSTGTNGAVLAFADVRQSAFLDILDGPQMAQLADALIPAVLATDEGERFLSSAAVWFDHNCGWDATARELGIHRHSLKARIHKGMASLDLSADKFPDRAELWSLLESRKYRADSR